MRGSWGTADDTLVNGNCTLREAIIAANTDTAVDACPAGSGADEIQLPANRRRATWAPVQARVRRSRIGGAVEGPHPERR